MILLYITFVPGAVILTNLNWDDTVWMHHVHMQFSIREPQILNDVTKF